MDQKAKAVLGIYPTRNGVEYAVEAFRDAGFRTADISLVLPEQMSADDLPSDVGANATEFDDTGPLLSGPLGTLNEIGPAVVSAAGTFLVAGPVAHALDEVASECAPIELATALIKLGIPDCETDEYAGKLMRGRALLSIHCDSAEEADAARRLHGDLGGMDIFSACRTDRTPSKFYRSLAHAAGK